MKQQNNSVAEVRQHDEITKTLLIFHATSWNVIEDEKTSLQLQDIMNIVTKTWNIDESLLKGKMKQSKIGIIQSIFLGLADIYSDLYNQEIAEWFGCRKDSVIKGKKLLENVLRLEWNNYEFLLSAACQCEKLSKGRLNKNVKPDIRSIKDVYVSNMDTGYFYLDSYKRSKIPVRDSFWFRNNNKLRAMAAYYPNGDVFYIESRTSTANYILNEMQNLGYRFMEFDYKEWTKYNKHHPICDRCIRKFNCSYYESDFRAHADEFPCFEGADNPTSVLPELLMLPYYEAS